MSQIPKLPLPFKRAFCFGCPVEKTEATKSGWHGVAYRKQPLFSDLRFAGWAEALKYGAVKVLSPLGHYEDKYPDEKILRPHIQKKILVEDYGIDPNQIEPLHTEANTWDHLVVIKRSLDLWRMSAWDCVILTSLYHDPRSNLFARLAGITGLLALPSESFLLLTGKMSKEDLTQAFGGGLLAETIVAEAQGIADLIAGNYMIQPSPSKQ